MAATGSNPYPNPLPHAKDYSIWLMEKTQGDVKRCHAILEALTAQLYNSSRVQVFKTYNVLITVQATFTEPVDFQSLGYVDALSAAGYPFALTAAERLYLTQQAYQRGWLLTFEDDQVTSTTTYTLTLPVD